MRKKMCKISNALTSPKGVLAYIACVWLIWYPYCHYTGKLYTIREFQSMSWTDFFVLLALYIPMLAAIIVKICLLKKREEIADMGLQCIFGHLWHECKCIRCGAVRDEQHDWVAISSYYNDPDPAACGGRTITYQCRRCGQTYDDHLA